MNSESVTVFDMELPSPRWLGKTVLLNLTDDRLRLRAQSLVQLAKSDRERLLVVYEFVKAMPFCAPQLKGPQTARQVLDARRGDACDKSTLFVALLRLVHLHARMRFVRLNGDVLRGYASGVSSVNHPVVEVWLGERWLKTDTHIYDIHYVANAREKLNAANWEMGYGIHRHAHSVWQAQDDAYAAFAPDQHDGQPLSDLGVFDDPRRFARAMRVQGQSHGWWHSPLKAARWAVTARLVQRGVRKLRAEIDRVAPPSLPAPVRIASN